MSLVRCIAALVIAAIFCVSCIENPSTQVNPTQQITPGQESLPFHVVEQAAPLGDNPKEAVYKVITTTSDWDVLNTRVPTSAMETGKAALASDKALYLLAFAGIKGTSGYSVNITTIRQAGSQYTVVVSETKPAEGAIIEPAMTLPYILVGVPLTELPHGENAIFVFTNPQGTILGQGEVQIP